MKNFLFILLLISAIKGYSQEMLIDKSIDEIKSSSQNIQTMPIGNSGIAIEKFDSTADYFYCVNTNNICYQIHIHFKNNEQTISLIEDYLSSKYFIKKFDDNNTWVNLNNSKIIAIIDNNIIIIKKLVY